MDTPISAPETALAVTFYTDAVPDGVASAAAGSKQFREEERVRIAFLGDSRSELHARAIDVSHPDPVTGEDVTYAMRFPREYAAFRAGKEDGRQSEIAELEARLAAAKAAVPTTTKAQLEKARADAEAAKAAKDADALARRVRTQATADAAQATVEAANRAAAETVHADFADAVGKAKS